MHRSSLGCLSRTSSASPSRWLGRSITARLTASSGSPSPEEPESPRGQHAVGESEANDRAGVGPGDPFDRLDRCDHEFPELVDARFSRGDHVIGPQRPRGRLAVWTSVVYFAVFNLAFAPWEVLGPFVARRSLGGAPAWGFILAAVSAGSLVGGFASYKLNPRRPLFVGYLVIAAIGVEPILLARPCPVAAIAVAALIGFATLDFAVTLWFPVLRQRIPEQVLSRVSSCDYLGSFVSIPHRICALRAPGLDYRPRPHTDGLRSGPWRPPASQRLSSRASEGSKEWMWTSPSPRWNLHERGSNQTRRSFIPGFHLRIGGWLAL